MTVMRPRRGRALLAFAMLLVTAWVVLPTSLGGQNAYVVTHGNSMEPRFRTGDLAVVRAADSYAAGDVTAYRSRSLHTTVLHRIVAVHDRRYVFKGDHNSFLDPEEPQQEQLIGTLVLRIPQGGTWLSRLTHPAVLALAALALLTLGTQKTRHRDRRRQRTATMDQTRTLRSPAISAATASPAGRTGLAVAATLAALGLLLALVAWKAPRDPDPGMASGPAATTTFAYHAAVAASAAYDSDTVTSPDPVFRRLTNKVDVQVHYTGPPGTLSVAADVAAPSGWHTSLPLLPAAPFDTTSHNANVTLDLNRIDARAKTAAQAIGIPYDQLTIALTTHVNTSHGQRLTPTLNLVLTSTQLKLAAGPSTLTVVAPPTQPSSAADPGTVRLLGHPVSTHTTAWLALGLFLAGVLSGLLTIVLGGRRPRDEAQAIQARHGSLLLPIKAPVVAGQGETVDVQDFAALARTAERYGLVIMTWSAKGGQTFMVQDQGVRYRYTTTPRDGAQRRRDRRQRNNSKVALAPALTIDRHDAAGTRQ